MHIKILFCDIKNINSIFFLLQQVQFESSWGKSDALQEKQENYENYSL